MTDTIVELPIKEILSDDEFNSRGFIDPASVYGLMQDIKMVGLLQPIVVRPLEGKPPYKYIIVVGHRRHKACHMLGMPTIKAIVRSDLDEQAALTLNISENLQREQLNIVQEGRAIDRYRKLWKWDASRIARELSVRMDWVQVRLDLLSLPEEIIKRAEAGFLTQYQIKAVTRLVGREEQLEYTRKCVDLKIKGKKIKTSKQEKEAAEKRIAKGAPRSKEEIFAMQERIQDVLDDVSCFAAKCLGWAAGVITTEDLEMAFEKECQQQGAHYARRVV